LANIHYLWKTPDIAKSFTTAISLHGHTLHSRESLRFIPDQAGKVTMLQWALRMQERRCTKPKADFSQGYWIAPLTPRAAWEIERDQIENKLGLAAMVSLTDHDTIEAPLMLRLLPQTRHIPISLEWTVPYENTQVHLGIHNLPSSSARQWLSAMRAYTHDRQNGKLADLLAGLHDITDLLIVLNHPMWDLCLVGRQAHLSALERFLRKHNQFLHAFELGGLRSWEENQRVVDFADAWNQSIISGGDRHGCEPNAVLNLTSAITFAEFVQEIRRDRKSHLVFMPQYQQSVILRMLHVVIDATRRIPEHPIGMHWDDRIFHPDKLGEIRPLSQLWSKAPAFIQTALSLIRVLEAEPVKALVQYLWGGSRNAFRLRPLNEDGEIA
jgi:hypothetical protein